MDGFKSMPKMNCMKYGGSVKVAKKRGGGHMGKNKQGISCHKTGGMVKKSSCMK